MLREFSCDLHIHTCLSPCADLSMYPNAIVTKSIQEHLDIIGICDHNSSENVEYTIKAAAGTPVTIMPGMELTSKEEVHILAFFGKIEELLALQKIVYTSLPGTNQEEIFGCQAIVNEHDEVEGINEHLLSGSINLSLSELVDNVHKLNGLAVAAHIDRPSFSIYGQLGFIPQDIQFDALEVSAVLGLQNGRKKYPHLSRYSMIESSDAHFIEEIGRHCTKIYMKTPTFSELKMAFHRQGGRYIGD